MQELAGQAVSNYQRAFEASETIDDLTQRMRLQQLAASYLIEVLNQVRDMTVAAARVQDSGKAVDMMTVGSAIAQFMMLMENEARTQLHDPDQFMQRMAEHAQTNFMTVDEVAKTTLTPARLEKEMRQMIESVPYVIPVAEVKPQIEDVA